MISRSWGSLFVLVIHISGTQVCWARSGTWWLGRFQISLVGQSLIETRKYEIGVKSNLSRKDIDDNTDNDVTLIPTITPTTALTTTSTSTSTPPLPIQDVTFPMYLTGSDRLAPTPCHGHGRNKRTGSNRTGHSEWKFSFLLPTIIYRPRTTHYTTSSEELVSNSIRIKSKLLPVSMYYF
jgi:hypothetical protein